MALTFTNLSSISGEPVCNNWLLLIIKPLFSNNNLIVPFIRAILELFHDKLNLVYIDYVI